jgi:hypothetical protein
MTVSDWLKVNRSRLMCREGDWVTQRVAVLEVPGRTITIGFDPIGLASQERVLSACLVELRIEEGRSVMNRIIQDAPIPEVATQRLIA